MIWGVLGDLDHSPSSGISLVFNQVTLTVEKLTNQSPANGWLMHRHVKFYQILSSLSFFRGMESQVFVLICTYSLFLSCSNINWMENVPAAPRSVMMGLQKCMWGPETHHRPQPWSCLLHVYLYGKDLKDLTQNLLLSVDMGLYSKTNEPIWGPTSSLAVWMQPKWGSS